MCGEHGRLSTLISSKLGSSPHARGAHGALRQYNALFGIIPACTGSTPSSSSGRSFAWDHPRMRGEHSGPLATSGAGRGSSLHARGALCLSARIVEPGGIIPACAGSTRPRGCRSASRWDHPRMRGEHCLSRNLFCRTAGSSPHARGALQTVESGGRSAGIIPACAGSTSPSRPDSPCRWDHPRMRGEHVGVLLQVFDYLGSSPHARGARGAVSVPITAAGIIPACAGSTVEVARGRCRREDHPRMRGEHLYPDRFEALGKGSSPHARGAPSRSTAYRLLQGIIPACAGSTKAGAAK